MTFLKTERLARNLSKIIKEASYLREKSDYDDFYIAVKLDVIKQLESAKTFINAVRNLIYSDVLLGKR